MPLLTSFCLQISQNGTPHEVIQVASHALPALGAHDVLVKILFAPINPADLNVIQGTYGRRPHLPCIPGHEAVGVVQAIGEEVTSLTVDDLVIPLLGVGCWTQHMVSAEHFFAKLPPSLDPVQAAMLRINPVTAWLLLRQFAPLVEGDWIAQNAANSAVGRSLIQIAKKQGLKTLNFVRRPELIPELLALGATAVFADTADGLAEARDHLGHDSLNLAANAVSGESSIRLMDLLSQSGTLVTYGAMSRTALKVPNGFLIFKDLILRGLWVTRWLEHASSSELYEALEPITEMMLAGELQLEIDRIVPFREAPAALLRAAESGRSGKVILDFA
jgi:mitochondrial enoyl-[acyl-carrier protein] reductase / trans-2-enoyl-CoA reductase